MSRTYRKHLAPGSRAKRGPVREPEGKTRRLKSHKQRRPNSRAALRKEFL